MRYLICLLLVCPIFLRSAVPLHEAFVTPSDRGILLKAIPYEPPSPVSEGIPRQRTEEAVWIPGYWYFSDEEDDFIWISGLWRRSPPKQVWTPGSWRKIQDGWVRLPGYWSVDDPSSMRYVAEPPPDPISENAGPPPSDDHYWYPGFWFFSNDSKKYEWVSGQWMRYNPQWILVPGQIIWRPEGYLALPPYWDYPLDKRGDLYSPVQVEPAARKGYHFTPFVILDLPKILEMLLASYPDYLPEVQHDIHYYPDRWKGLMGVPVWLSWPEWWTLPSMEQWALWWWYTHPGYPAPFWISPQLVQYLPVPSEKQVQLAAFPPPQITKRGPISRQHLLESIRHFYGVPRENAVVPVVPHSANFVAFLPPVPRKSLRPLWHSSKPLKRVQLPRFPVPNVTPAKHVPSRFGVPLPPSSIAQLQ